MCGELVYVCVNGINNPEIMNPSSINILENIKSHGPWRIKFFKILDHVCGAPLAMLFPRRKRLEIRNWKKALVIRPGGMGDAVYTLPFIRTMIAQGMSVDVLCETRNAQVFLSQDDLDIKVGRWDKPDELLHFLKNHYDVIIDTEQWHWLTAWMAGMIKSNIRVGFDSRPRRARMYDTAVIYDQGNEFDNFRRLFSAVVHMPDDVKMEGCFYFKDQGDIKADKPYACVSLRASIALRRISYDYAQQIVNDLFKQGLDVVFLKQQSLGDIARIMKGARFFIGPDSGLLAVADALGIPTIALFGPGNVNKWAPRGEKHKVISAHLPCSPCTRFGYTVPTCHGRYDCVRQMPKISREMLIKGVSCKP